MTIHAPPAPLASTGRARFGPPARAQDVHVAVVIPCHDERGHVEAVVTSLPPEVRTIVVVDDGSTDGTAEALARIDDPRLRVVRHDRNRGVGAAVKTGYQAALAAGADICVKMDGDGQMAAEDVPRLIEPLLRREADYAKGNRFARLPSLARMPGIRLLGNGVLSFLTKAVSGYWSILDPTNGFTAIRSEVLRLLDLERAHPRYFFETSMLVELNVRGAVIRDVDVDARYGSEVSGLRIGTVLREFPPLLVSGLCHRFLRKYMIRDFNALTICVLGGLPAVAFGVIFGAYHWIRSIATGVPATAGTTILAALPIILGFQCLLTALVLDGLYEPRRPLTAAPNEERGR
jgi:dolichol-phosphate mannosyltransferase